MPGRKTVPLREQTSTTFTLPERPVSQWGRTLEVRWFFPGLLEPRVAAWMGRFPAEMESREDSYLLDPPLPGLSVKIRAGRALEVKTYRGSPGILDVPGRARGHLESWQKWSFPLGPRDRDSGDAPGWKRVCKTRWVSRFSLVNGRRATDPAGLAGQPGCAVELTDVRAGGEAWWSLGFEAAGPTGLLRGQLEYTAALVFAQAMPDGIQPRTENSRSYAEWLGQQVRPRA